MDNLQAIAKSLAPPALWAALRAIKAPKVYRTWAEAASAAGAYDASLINEFRAARAALNSGGEYSPDLTGSPLLALLAASTAPVSVTDFGGGTGEDGAALKRLIPGLTYTVAEIPALVALMPPGGPVQFVTHIPASCDWFYSAGVLQYLERPYEALAEGLKTARRGVILTRNFFGPPAFLAQRSRLHENGSGAIPPDWPDRIITYPVQTMQEAQLVQAVAEARFRLAYRAPGDCTPFIPGAYGADLVFLKA